MEEKESLVQGSLTPFIRWWCHTQAMHQPRAPVRSLVTLQQIDSCKSFLMPKELWIPSFQPARNPTDSPTRNNQWVVHQVAKIHTKQGSSGERHRTVSKQEVRCCTCQRGAAKTFQVTHLLRNQQIHPLGPGDSPVSVAGCGLPMFWGFTPVGSWQSSYPFPCLKSCRIASTEPYKFPNSESCRIANTEPRRFPNKRPCSFNCIGSNHLHKTNHCLWSKKQQSHGFSKSFYCSESCNFPHLEHCKFPNSEPCRFSCVGPWMLTNINQWSKLQPWR